MENGLYKFEIEADIYPIAVIVKTSVLFLDDYYIFLENGSPGRIVVNITPKNGVLAKQMNIQEEFCNKLIFTAARIESYASNKALRELIVGKALFSAVTDWAPDNQRANIGFAQELGLANWEKRTWKKKK